MKDLKEQDAIEEQVVVITDEDGKEYYYFEEEVIQVGDKRFAILVSVEKQCSCEDEACACDEDEAIIAKIEVDENGEDVYCNPTDDEYDEVLKLYEDDDKDEQ